MSQTVLAQDCQAAKCSMHPHKQLALLALDKFSRLTRHGWPRRRRLPCSCTRARQTLLSSSLSRHTPIVCADLLQAYEAWEAEEEASSQQLAAQQRKARKAKGKGAAGKKGGAAGKGKKANPWSDGDGSDDDGDDDDFMDEDQPRKVSGCC